MAEFKDDDDFDYKDDDDFEFKDEEGFDHKDDSDFEFKDDDDFKWESSTTTGVKSLFNLTKNKCVFLTGYESSSLMKGQDLERNQYLHIHEKRVDVITGELYVS